MSLLLMIGVLGNVAESTSGSEPPPPEEAGTYTVYFGGDPVTFEDNPVEVTI
jgi:hypothetical protein